MSALSAQQWRDKLIETERSADPRAALALASKALADHPTSAPLHNMAGNIAMRADEYEVAAGYFASAAKLEPDALEFLVNQAIARSAMGDRRGAIELLETRSEKGRTDARFCACYGHAARALGWLDQAALWYERALAANPAHPRALLGRARVAIERSEADTKARFEAAIRVNPGDPFGWLGLAQALDVEGDTQGARKIAEQLVDSAPAWTEGLRFLAQLRLGAGEEDYTSHYRDAAAKAPQEPAIMHEWIAQLAGLDHASEAADVAAEARRRFADSPAFALEEAIHAGSAGDDERAEQIFANLAFDTRDRRLHEARHRIRLAQLDRAGKLLGSVIEEDRGSIAAWALRGIVWRLNGDARAEWLHGQPGLFGPKPLAGKSGVLEGAIALLHELHDNSPLPLGQSLRGGTQTRGNIFWRQEPELRELQAAILESVENYRAGLPDEDPAHPLLAHRNKRWRIEGSWSVRLAGGGDYHTSHIHPQGIVSSALYVERSNAGEDAAQAGWLEVGRPPPDLRLDLPPLAMIEPNPGNLALFPSTLYHGTRPFAHGRRMTVAFDIVLDE